MTATRNGRKAHHPAAGVGFTQVELLVVIGIIALLAAVLLPSVESARSKGKSARAAAVQDRRDDRTYAADSQPNVESSQAAPALDDVRATLSATIPAELIQVVQTAPEDMPKRDRQALDNPPDAAVALVPPPNDLCTNAIRVAAPSLTFGTTDGATPDSDFPTCLGNSGFASPGVWYTVVGTGHTMSATTCNTTTIFDTQLTVYCPSCATPVCVTGNDDACGPGGGFQSYVSWCSQLGQTYFIRVHGYDEVEFGPFRLDLADNGTTCNNPASCVAAPPCDLTCGPNQTRENEANCGLPNDTVNGGCNSTPNVFTPIACGQSYCGTGAFNGTNRDTDWYKLVLTAPTSVTWTVAAEFDLVAGIVETGGVDSCAGVDFRVSRIGLPCGTVSVTSILCAGTWYLFVAPDFTVPVPCGKEYTATLSCGTPPPGCCLPSGSCQQLPAAQCSSSNGTVVSHCPCDGRCVPPGDDCFTTGCGRTLFDFCNDPIPADFFAPSSAPFSGVIVLGGAEDGLPDTRVRRFNAMLLDGPPETVPIELVQLSLVSCDPITVDIGTVPTKWNVAVGLSRNEVPPGGMTAAKTHPNGGTFSAQFNVLPLFTFTEVGVPSNQKVLDFGATGRPPTLFQTTDTPKWVHQLSPLMQHTPCGVNFVPGVEQNPQTLEQCCTETCHANPAGGHNHCTKQCNVCPRGACCNPQNGTCSVVQGAAACLGQYKGDGTNCADSDGDGLPDWFENNDCCQPSTPCNAASNPNDPDTDNDGVLDGAELAAGCDPCVPGCTQACCLPNGTCRDATPADCRQAGGVSMGANTRCQGDRNGDGIDDACAAKACEECGPGLHWIHNPPCPPGGTGSDTMSSGAVAGFDIDNDCIADVNVVLSGPVTISKKGPRDDSAQYPGLRPVDGHLDVIDTEIVSMSLTGAGVTLTAGRGRGANPLRPSTGAIAEQGGNPSLADSFFDVFFEIDQGGGQLAYNLTPVRVETDITCLPPDGLYAHVTGCIPLYSSPLPGQGTFVGNLVSANHFTYPGCCLPGGQCVDASGPACQELGGKVVPECLGDLDHNTIDDACERKCAPNADGSACEPVDCDAAVDRCLPRCVNFDPATGRVRLTACDCANVQECHAQLAAPTGVVAGGPGSCIVPDNGGGSVDLPPAGCEYLSPDEVHKIIDGLPAGTEIHLAPIHKDFICHEPGTQNTVCSFQTLVDCKEAGGSLGGEKECAQSNLQLDLSVVNPPCPGPLCGYARSITVPMGFETHIAPRTPGDPVQSFDTDMFRLFGQMIGDPDFDLLRVVGGTDFGLPSPGHTTLTRLGGPGGNWAVDSFFDITYRIDFVGAPGGPLAGRSGSTTGTIRMQTTPPFKCVGGCPSGEICVPNRTPNPDGSINVCCDCRPNRVVEIDDFPSTSARMELQFSDGSSEVIDLSGPTTVHVFFEGANEGDSNDSDGDGLDDVDTEIVNMNLTGVSPAYGPVTVRLHPTKPSRGQIEETVNTQAGRLDLPPFAPGGTATSFFDVFFEIQAAGRVFHTQQPKRMSSVITHKPPAPGDTYENLEKIPLLDENGNTTGLSIGAGRHTPRPPVEVDIFPNTTAQMELQFPGGGSELISLSGPTTVHVFFEGANEGEANDSDGDDLDDVETEMVSMELTGVSPIFGPVTVRVHPTKPSRGQIEETANTQAGRLDLPPFAPGGTATSFFDVFFEIQAADRVFHTQQPKRMSSVITHKPPAPGDTYENLEKIPLLDENGIPTGITIGAGRHVPNPGCTPNATGTACNPVTCPDPLLDEKCLPKCVNFDPTTGRVRITDCDCTGLDKCHAQVAPAVETAGPGAACVVPDNGGGTVTLPPANCGYVSPSDVHMIIDGLPAGTTIEIGVEHQRFFCPTNPLAGACSFAPPTPGVDCDRPGGSLGGEQECSNSFLAMNMHGTGGLAGFNRLMGMQVSFETHVGPRAVGDPVQSFDTDMFRLQGQLPLGDPDFDLLRITAGTGFGMPSPGHTTLTRLGGPGGNWAVDSFFDITYRIDFVGAPGGPLAGRSGSTTGTIRMQTTPPFKCVGGCPSGEICVPNRTPNPDGTINVCCDCRPQRAVEIDDFPSTTAKMELQFLDGSSEVIDLSGPTTVKVYFEGANEGDADDSDGDGLDDVETEMVRMELTGVSPIFGPVIVRVHPTKPSRGQIEETVNTQAGRLDLPPFAPGGTATSFFDVFFEIQAADRVFHTQQPKRMSSVITHKPPAPGDTYQNPDKIPLLDENGNPTGITIGAGGHTPRPQCGSPGTGDCFTPHITPFCDRGECCECVCAVLPSCCSVGWSEVCAGLAREICVQPTVVKWESVLNHSPNQPVDVALVIPDDGRFSESRSAVRKLVVTFDRAIDPASAVADNVNLCGLKPGTAPGTFVNVDLSGIAITVSMTGGDTKMKIEFNPGLPDHARYRITLKGLRGRCGPVKPGTGGLSRIFTALQADASGDLRVNATDVGGVRSLVGTNPINPTILTHVRSDANNDGRINATDVGGVRSRVGRDARAIPDPLCP